MIVVRLYSYADSNQRDAGQLKIRRWPSIGSTFINSAFHFYSEWLGFVAVRFCCTLKPIKTKPHKSEIWISKVFQKTGILKNTCKMNEHYLFSNNYNLQQLRTKLMNESKTVTASDTHNTTDKCWVKYCVRGGCGLELEADWNSIFSAWTQNNSNSQAWPSFVINQGLQSKFSLRPKLVTHRHFSTFFS